MSDHTWQLILGGLSNPLLAGMTGWEILGIELDYPELWVQLSDGERDVIRRAAEVADEQRARDVVKEYGDG